LKILYKFFYFSPIVGERKEEKMNWQEVGRLRGGEGVYYLPSEDRINIKGLHGALLEPTEEQQKEIQSNPEIQKNVKLILALLIAGDTGEE